MAYAAALLPEAEPPTAGDNSHLQRRGLISTIVFAPVSMLLALLCSIVDLLRPFAHQIIPVLVCVFLVPLIVFLSVYSGWVVWRSAPVSWQVPLNLQYGDGSQPYAQAAISGVASYQPYDITLQLTVPATDANVALGNFMASVDFFTPSNATITSVRRSAIVLPATPPRFFALSSQRRLISLDVPLLDSFALSSSHVRVEVELGRRDRWKTLGNGEGRELSVYSASLTGIVRHRGIRGLVSRFPLISAVVASLIFLMINLLVVGACVLPMVLSGEVEYATAPPDVPSRASQTAEFDSSSGTQKLPGSRTRTRRGPIRRLAQAVKTEDEPVSTLIPGSEPSHRPLRRRRSRIGEELSDSDV